MLFHLTLAGGRRIAISYLSQSLFKLPSGMSHMGRVWGGGYLVPPLAPGQQTGVAFLADNFLPPAAPTHMTVYDSYNGLALWTETT